MWENRCKVAVSGVGFSKVTRSAEIPLAAHALEAVKAAVADSGLKMSDIDGLATYPELPATGHAEVDGISIVSVNCMMAMLKLPNLTWHIQVGTTNIGGARSQGFEFEVLAMPVEGLTIGLNGSLNEAEVTSLTPEEAAISGAVLGARLAGPRVQGSLFVNYNFDLTEAAEGNFSLAVQHVGSYPGSFPNVPGQPGVVSPTYDFTESYTVVNSTFALAFDRQTDGFRWEALVGAADEGPHLAVDQALVVLAPHRSFGRQRKRAHHHSASYSVSASA